MRQVTCACPLHVVVHRIIQRVGVSACAPCRYDVMQIATWQTVSTVDAGLTAVAFFTWNNQQISIRPSVTVVGSSYKATCTCTVDTCKMHACKFYLWAYIRAHISTSKANQFGVIQIPTLTIWKDTEQTSVQTTHTSSRHGARDMTPQYNVHVNSRYTHAHTHACASWLPRSSVVEWILSRSRLSRTCILPLSPFSPMTSHATRSCKAAQRFSEHYK